MGAEDWMLLYAHGEVAPVLRSAPSLDREAARALIARLYPGHRIAELDDGNLAEDANPPAGCRAVPGRELLAGRRHARVAYLTHRRACVLSVEDRRGGPGAGGGWR